MLEEMDRNNTDKKATFADKFALFGVDSYGAIVEFLQRSDKRYGTNMVQQLIKQFAQATIN